MLKKITPTISVLISLASFILALLAFTTARSHFYLLNQAYLDAEPTIHLWTPDRGAPSVAHVSRLPESITASGLNVGITLKNVGNLPLKYTVKEFTIDIDGHRYANIQTTDYSEGIIYPKQEKSFNAATIKFSTLGKGVPLSYKELHQLKVSGAIKIEYKNINAKGDMKTWDRTLNVELFETGAKVTWTSFNDKV